jgi:DnaJ-class molecular chaperone
MLLALGAALALFAGIMSLRNRGGSAARPGVRCPRCEGRGWFRTNYGKRKCLHCRGRGTV